MFEIVGFINTISDLVATCGLASTPSLSKQIFFPLHRVGRGSSSL